MTSLEKRAILALAAAVILAVAAPAAGDATPRPLCQGSAACGG